MLDFAAWTQRVSAFLRRLTRLPGAINIYDSVEPPATDRYDLDWLESDKSGIPNELRRFLATGSKRCAFGYNWTPPAEHLAANAGVFSGCPVFHGGGDLCEAAKYHNYADRDWFRDNLDPLFASFGLAEEANNLTRRGGAMAEEQMHGRVPILELKDGAVISLALQERNDIWAVVYVKKAGDPATQILGQSFERFLLDWEMTCYTDPSIDNLAPWIDPVTRQLCPDPEKSRALCRLLCGNDL
jgi:hypothetical protein